MKSTSHLLPSWMNIWFEQAINTWQRKTHLILDNSCRYLWCRYLDCCNSELHQCSLHNRRYVRTTQIRETSVTSGGVTCHWTRLDPRGPSKHSAGARIRWVTLFPLISLSLLSFSLWLSPFLTWHSTCSQTGRCLHAASHKKRGVGRLIRGDRFREWL